MHIRSLAAGFTFRTAEYTGFPGDRLTQNSTAPDFETCSTHFYSVKM